MPLFEVDVGSILDPTRQDRYRLCALMLAPDSARHRLKLSQGFREQDDNAFPLFQRLYLQHQVPDIERRFFHASVMGEIGRRILTAQAQGPPVRFEDTAAAVLKDVRAWKGKPGELAEHLSMKTIHNAVRPRYGPVVHFWLAHRTLAEESAGAAAWPSAPRDGQAFRFFELANDFYRRGTETKFFRSNKRLINNADSWKIEYRDHSRSIRE